MFEVLKSRNWTYYNHIGLTYFVIVFTLISSLLLFVRCRMLVLPNGFELETAGIDSYSIRPGTRSKCRILGICFHHHPHYHHHHHHQHHYHPYHHHNHPHHHHSHPHHHHHHYHHNHNSQLTNLSLYGIIDRRQNIIINMNSQIIQQLAIFRQIKILQAMLILLWRVVRLKCLRETQNLLRKTKLARLNLDCRSMLGYLGLQGSVVRKMNSAIHWIVIFTNFLNMFSSR